MSTSRVNLFFPTFLGELSMHSRESKIDRQNGPLKLSAAGDTLPKTNSLPLKIGPKKERIVFQPSIFRSKMLVSGRVESIHLKILDIL